MCIRTGNEISKLYTKLLKIKPEIFKYTSKIYNYKQVRKIGHTDGLPDAIPLHNA